jgi:HEAT repeat protein
MAKFGPLARPALADLCRTLRDADPRTASGAAQALGSMGAEGGEAVPHLAEAMRGANIVLCRLAAKALSEIGVPALPTLIIHLQNSDPFVRAESAMALGWMGPAARAAVPFLVRLLQDANADRNQTPSPGLHETDGGGTGLASEAVTPTLPANGVVSSEETCRLYAAQALGRIGSGAASAVPVLDFVTRSGSKDLRKAAQQAIDLIRGAE